MDDSYHDEDTNDDYDDDDDDDADVDVDDDDEFDGFDNFRYEVKCNSSYPYLHSKLFARIDNCSHWINGALLCCSCDSYYRYDWNFLIQFFF